MRFSRLPGVRQAGTADFRLRESPPCPARAMSNAVTMIHGGANNGQAQGGVHRRFEGNRLNRNQSLVVIHAGVSIGLPSLAFGEGGVGWERAHDIATICGALRQLRVE